MQRDVPREAPTGSFDSLSLRCALVLFLGLVGFGLTITVGKAGLSLLVGDVSVYLIVIFAIAIAIWALTWYYMARFGVRETRP